jgi:hypothetical protein
LQCEGDGLSEILHNFLLLVVSSRIWEILQQFPVKRKFAIISGSMQAVGSRRGAGRLKHSDRAHSGIRKDHGQAEDTE